MNIEKTINELIDKIINNKMGQDREIENDEKIRNIRYGI